MKSVTNHSIVNLFPLRTHIFKGISPNDKKVHFIKLKIIAKQTLKIQLKHEKFQSASKIYSISCKSSAHQIFDINLELSFIIVDISLIDMKQLSTVKFFKLIFFASVVYFRRSFLPVRRILNKGTCREISEELSTKDKELLR